MVSKLSHSTYYKQHPTLNKYMKYHNNFSNVNNKMHASSKTFFLSYLVQGVPNGDEASTLGPWNVPSVHRKLVTQSSDINCNDPKFLLTQGRY